MRSCLFGFALGSAICLGAVFLFLSSLMWFELPGRSRTTEIYYEALALCDAGQFEQSLALYEELLELGDDGHFVWLGIAECYEGLERMEESYGASDAALERGLYWPAVERLHCIAHFEGLAAALEWFEAFPRLSRESVVGNQILGTFLGQHGALDLAVTARSDAFEIANRELGVEFDIEGHVVDGAVLRRADNQVSVQLHDAAEALAELYFLQGLHGDAYHWATRGIVIGGQAKRTLGYYSVRSQKSGCADCRIVRAEILVERGEFDAARSELVHVDYLSSRTNYVGWARKAALVREQMDELESTKADER